jgi:hypothetical protein
MAGYDIEGAEKQVIQMMPLQKTWRFLMTLITTRQ